MALAWIRRHPTAEDAFLALALALAGMVILIVDPGRVHAESWQFRVFPLVLAAIVMRRRYPAILLAATVALAVTLTVLYRTEDPAVTEWSP